MLNKALSPLAATTLLVIAALIIGTVTMSIANNYASVAPDEGPSASLIISLDNVDTPLKELQIKYITGKIGLQEYLQQEQQILKHD